MSDHKMKITGTRSQIIVEIENRILRISGELTTTPVFYADANSIKCWEKGNERIEISKEEKTELIKRIEEESNKEGRVKVVFD